MAVLVKEMSARSHTIGHNNPLTPTARLSRFRYVYPLLSVLILLAATVFLFDYLGNAVRFPVSRVEVGGKVVFVDKTQLMQIVKKHTQRGFFGLSIGEVREEVMALPWVKEALVRRVLPDRLHIAVVERVAGMQWNDTGLIDSDGEVFYPSQLAPDNPELPQWHERFAELPHLRGSEERKSELQKIFALYRNVLQGEVPILQGLQEDDRRSQTLLLEGNIVVRLGYEKTTERLDRFRKLFPAYLSRESAY